MNSYLIPANTKKSKLVFSMFTWFDLILFGSGIAVTLLLLLILPINGLVAAIIALSPAVITGFLVFPIPNYHNVLTVIRNVISFYSNRRVFVWKGWCVKDGFKDEKR